MLFKVIIHFGVMEKVTEVIRNASYRYFEMVCSLKCVRLLVDLQAGILNDQTGFT
jgi:hypothetical protein